MVNILLLFVSMQGFGNDLFIYWILDCIGYEGDGKRFEFVEGINVYEQSCVDICKFCYNVKSFSKLYVINYNIGFFGEEIYYLGGITNVL